MELVRQKTLGKTSKQQALGLAPTKPKLCNRLALRGLTQTPQV